MARPPVPVEVRIWAHIDRRGDLECWPWHGKRDRGGYGVIAIRGSQVVAHRIVYESVVASIPDGLVIDHLCRNRACCNPAHMEPVTDVENILRGSGFAARNARKTTCSEGHPYDYTHPTLGWRRCTTCDNNRRRPRRRKQTTP